jgi:ACR3 family arsenite efflux pump ArsB
LEILKSSTLNKITKYWYIAILAMLVIGIGYSYFVFTTDATEGMNNFNTIQIIIPIVIITLVIIIMQKKRIKIQSKKDGE